VAESFEHARVGDLARVVDLELHAHAALDLGLARGVGIDGLRHIQRPRTRGLLVARLGRPRALCRGLEGARGRDAGGAWRTEELVLEARRANSTPATVRAGGASGTGTVKVPVAVEGTVRVVDVQVR
jgi:hypothetical protein